MCTWQVLRRGTTVALAGAAVVVGVSMASTPAGAQETIACVSNKLGLVRIVDDEFDCKPWEHAQTIGGGGSGVKLVFVTSTRYQGNIPAPDCAGCTTGIERARFECNRLAGEANLPGEYEPWLSDGASNAADRFDDLGADGPWFNVNGDHVAASLQGMLTLKNGTDYLYNPVLFTELGEEEPVPGNTWTGTMASGTIASGTCTDWGTTAELSLGRDGINERKTVQWTDASVVTCNTALRLYCFQSE